MWAAKRGYGQGDSDALTLRENRMRWIKNGIEYFFSVLEFYCPSGQFKNPDGVITYLAYPPFGFSGHFIVTEIFSVKLFHCGSMLRKQKCNITILRDIILVDQI